MVSTFNQESSVQAHASNQSQDDDIVLSVKGVSKKFCRDLKRSLMYGVQDITSELFGLRGSENDRLRKKEFWALQDVSFELQRGKALGLIGKNGSGKSTLLRIIAGLIKPDKGIVEVRGRVAPLIALGAGFNPILTGRENIYANMSILGLTKKEIDEQFDDVVEFAEIGEAIDSPVQSYSSGMAARLGFSSAIHTNPDLLLIDEVLAVGDIRFRQKCFRRLSELRQDNTAFVLVSHNPQAILNTCDTSVYLSESRLISSGVTHEVMSEYERAQYAFEYVAVEDVFSSPVKKEEESYGLDIRTIFFKDEANNTAVNLRTGIPVKLCVSYYAHRLIDDVDFVFSISELVGEAGVVLRFSSRTDDFYIKAPEGLHELCISMPHLSLKPGMYTMNVAVRQGRLFTLDLIESYRFQVFQGERIDNSRFYQPKEWVLSKKD